MRGLRSTLALLVVLLGLGTYIYFVTWKEPESTRRERVFTALEADEIDEMTITSQSGDTTTVKKDDGAWRMTAPLEVRADAAKIESMTSNLGSLEIARAIDESPADLKEYGLEPPLVTIEFKAAGDSDGGQSHRLFLGSKSPTSGDLFAKRDAESRVVLVPGYVEPIFDRSTFDLRDKTLLAFERAKIDSIAISAGGKTLEFAKEEAGWKITRPIAALADATAVEALIGQLVTTQAKSIVAEPAAPADLKKYGFDKPQATATVTGGGATASLVVGARATDEEVYASDASTPLIATVGGALLEDLQKEANDYRRRDIFASRGYSIDRLEFVRDEQTIVMEKVKTAGQSDRWRRLGPNPGEPDAMNVTNLIARLESLRAATFVASTAKTGLDRPVLTVSVKFDDEKKDERVLFAKAGGAVYAVVPGQPGAVTIAPTAFDEALKALDLISK